jgi:GTP-binding protein EngB required for normal cell division
VTPRELLTAALVAADGAVDPTPIALARAALDEPVRALVVGRRGAGKSSLVTWWTGKPRPVGLGGVTRTAEEVVGGGWVLVDTPGFEGTDDAVIHVLPLAERAEVVVWVTDGLQAWTSTERAVHAALAAPDLPVLRVVSRADLVDEADRAEVLERLAALSPLPTAWADLRRAARERPAPPFPAPSPSPRRAARVRALLDPVTAPTLPTSASVRARFREGAKAALDGVVARWESGELRGAPAVRAALADAHEAVLAELRPAVPGPLPALPPPQGPARVDRRSLRAAGADWVSAGELALDDGWEPLVATRRRRLDAFRAALDAARASL